jgi:hypothetical protein
VITGARINTGAGNDSLNFAGNVTAATAVINAGAGNDTMTFSALTSAASILGGSGNDSLAFTSSSNAQRGGVASDAQYFHNGGTDTLFFTGTVTGTAAILNVNVDSSLFSSVAANSSSGGTTIVGSNTSGGTTSSTTLAYILGASTAANITASRVATFGQWRRLWFATLALREDAQTLSFRVNYEKDIYCRNGFRIDCFFMW